jgi:hypothetical protein
MIPQIFQTPGQMLVSHASELAKLLEVAPHESL